MTIGTCPLSWSLSGVKQTSLVAAHMSACDPKRTSIPEADVQHEGAKCCCSKTDGRVAALDAGG